MLDSDLIRFFADNIGRLEPFDYFLVCLIGTLIGFGAYFIVRSIYRQVIAAQEKLLIIKEKTIEHQERTLTAIEADKAKLEAQFTHTLGELEQLRQQLQTKDEQHNRKLNELFRQHGILIRLTMLARVGVLQLNILHTYRARAALMTKLASQIPDKSFQVPDAIGTNIEELMAKIFDVLDILKIYKEEGNDIRLPTEVPQRLFQTMMVDVNQARIGIRDKLDMAQPLITQEVEKLVKQLR